MKSVVEYGIVGLILSALFLLVLLPFTGSDTHRGMTAAVLFGLPLQVGLFALMVRFRSHPLGFLGAWVGGMVGRLMLLGLMLVVVLRRDDLPPAATLLTLAGLLFGLLLLEPLFLRKPGREPGTG